MSFLRPFFALLSLSILALAAYLLWSWYQGELVRYPDGAVVRVREDWQLWLGLVLLAWAFIGRSVVLWLFARPDTHPTRPERGNGEQLPSAGGALLYVEALGPANAPTVILVHGWSLDSTIWFYAKRALAERFRVIVWDHRGLGKSKVESTGAVQLSNMAEDLRTVMRYAGPRPAVLVGHSIGGMTIQTLLRDHPETFQRQVAGVVLLNTTHTNPLNTIILSGLLKALRYPVIEPMLWLQIWLEPLAKLGSWQSYLSGSAHLAARLGFTRNVTRSQLEHTTLLMTRNSPGVQARGDLAMFRWDATNALPRLSAPTLVIGGADDIVTKPEASHTIAAAAATAKLQVIEDANHMSFLDRHEVYNAAIAAFVEAVQPRGQTSEAEAKSGARAGR
jgi:pimeloyl-ACP methyl ester carboxylesterase